MAKGLTKTELEARMQDMNARAHVAEMALQLSTVDDPDTSETVRDGRDRYTVRSYGLTRHDGGYVVAVFYSGTVKQKPTVYAYAADKFIERNKTGIFAHAAGFIDGTRMRLLAEK